MIRLDHRFRVPLPMEEAWTTLSDLATIARCLPGAQLDAVVDGRYEGVLSTRTGHVGARYRGSAHVVERDEVDHRMVIQARGREEEGTGTVSALIALALHPDGPGTEVTVRSGSDIDGTAAQAGRDLLTEAGTTMLDTFVRNLEASIDAADAPAPETNGHGAVVPRPAPVPDADATRPDVLRTVPAPVTRRPNGYVLGAAIGLLVGIVLGRTGRVAALRLTRAGG